MKKIIYALIAKRLWNWFRRRGTQPQRPQR